MADLRVIGIDPSLAVSGAATPDDAWLTVTVHGTPGPQGSKTFYGRGQVVESSRKVEPWRNAVRVAAKLALTDQRGILSVPPPPLRCPVAVAMTFSLTRPAFHHGTGRNAGRVKAGAPPWPTTYPDLSKLARSTEDALTGVAWRDDAQVVSYLRLAKVYAGASDPDALPAPGAIIRIYRMEVLNG